MRSTSQSGSFETNEKKTTKRSPALPQVTPSLALPSQAPVYPKLPMTALLSAHQWPATVMEPQRAQPEIEER